MIVFIYLYRVTVINTYLWLAQLPENDYMSIHVLEKSMTVLCYIRLTSFDNLHKICDAKEAKTYSYETDLRLTAIL